jgi:diguanylate cyclase (GGDEF)-like protein/PAS domain S-box-containing protein
MEQSPRPDEGLVDQDQSISARDVLEAAPDALVIVNETGHIVELNAPTAELFGYSRRELLGQAVETLVPPRYRRAHVGERLGYHKEPRRRPMGGGPELYGVRRDGTEFPVEISLSPLVTRNGTLVIAAIRDITARKKAETERLRLLRERAVYEEISRLARQDALTGLPNRTLLSDRLTAAIAAAGRHQERLAVLFFDLDRFKQVNDSFGHETGDRLLKSIASRLTATVRASDTVSRQGGDEFVILLTEVQRADVARVTRKIIAAVAGPHQLGPHELYATASIGIAMYPDDGDTAEGLIKNADIAMYYAKDHGRDSFQFFREEMNTRIVERQALEGSLRRAMERHEFTLHYQPKIDLVTGALIGAEALVRWQHPDRGLIPPELFVPLAEDTGLIIPLGKWVLREACRQSREWQMAGLAAVPVAVNISALEFKNESFLDSVRTILAETGLDPQFLELELTETVLMENAASSAEVLHQLKAIGVRVAVDDFGTGYSSLSYLMQFPIDALKVDQSFIRDIAGASGSPIVKAVISMGKSLKHRVIAEGVETKEQLAFLQEHECEEGQGFHFSPPLVADQFAALLAPAH